MYNSIGRAMQSLRFCETLHIALDKLNCQIVNSKMSNCKYPR